MTQTCRVLYIGSISSVHANSQVCTFISPSEKVVWRHSVQSNWREFEVSSTHEMPLTSWQPHFVQRAREVQYRLLDGSVVVYDGIDAHVVVSRLYHIVVDENEIKGKRCFLSFRTTPRWCWENILCRHPSLRTTQ